MTQSLGLKAKKLMIARLHQRNEVLFMNKKKIFKKLGIILLAIIIIILIHTVRNMIIISNTQKTIKLY